MASIIQLKTSRAWYIILTLLIVSLALSIWGYIYIIKSYDLAETRAKEVFAGRGSFAPTESDKVQMQYTTSYRVIGAILLGIGLIGLVKTAELSINLISTRTSSGTVRHINSTTKTNIQRK